MTPTWSTNDDGTQRCHGVCGLASFPVGEHCKCPVGSPVTSPEVDRNVSHQTDPGLPTSNSYERRLIEIADEFRSTRMEICDSTADGATAPLIDGNDQRLSAWRLRLQSLDMERKGAEALHRTARERELPELVERMEETVKTARNRKGRMTGNGSTEDVAH